MLSSFSFSQALESHFSYC